MMYGKLSTETYNIRKPFAKKEELALYQQLFSKKDRLFEPMCGNGRLLIPLMQLGYKIEGLDNSKSMLTLCQKHAKKRRLSPTLYAADIETFIPTKHYDGILIPFASFQLFYPDPAGKNMLAKFKGWLRPGGKLVMDLFVPEPILHEPGNDFVQSFEATCPNKDIIITKTYITIDRDKQHLLYQTHFTKYRQGTVIAEEQETQAIRWYFPDEIKQLLIQQGFSSVTLTDRHVNDGPHTTVIADA